MDWNQKPYHSLDYELKRRFGRKIYKLSLDGGMTCPNRDGTLGNRGCIFCSSGGSGDFAAKACPDVWEQIEAAKARVRRKMPPGSSGATIAPGSNGATIAPGSNGETIAPRSSGATIAPESRGNAGTASECNASANTAPESRAATPPSYIAYFQSYTNTYAPLPRLRSLFERAVSHPDVALLSVATRPDCLPDETVSLLAGLNHRKPVWVELGLQTVHEDTARFIRRGYGFPVFEDACRRLKAAGITVVVHVILGLPGEDRERMLETITRMADFSRAGLIDGIKLQLLHVLKGTDLADYYQNHPFPIFSMEEYIDFLIDCAELLPPELVIHRLTGDGPKSLLVAPSWSGNKRLVLNTLARRFKERNTWQGRLS
ncbi:TIGR01212 family radical SAM protein [Enterocloster lavalensis]|uniref:TIGR01212 family radical SAM protein n=1 Tax=Enterocloster lavalensis TaxID=460384 RepID=UPI001D0834A5|nr:TIGR01212 family radical SAM protein [Enterocloster lavalensis]MCB6344115.1 TIGR01212 family radical SAM protein [Enterocloster lavalensis]